MKDRVLIFGLTLGKSIWLGHCVLQALILVRSKVFVFISFERKIYQLGSDIVKFLTLSIVYFTRNIEIRKANYFNQLLFESRHEKT